MRLFALVFLLYLSNCDCGPVEDNYIVKPLFNTTIQTENVTNYVQYKIVDKPHHLFIGRCGPNDTLIHQENIILKNDGNSHVSANIRIMVEGPVKFACVKIFDEVANGQGGYPSYVGGGLGTNFVEFNVLTVFGKGFHFFVQIYEAYQAPSADTNVIKSTS